ncbi:MAG: hypothetical protein ACQBVK_00805 [Candidatus Phytoplasma sp. TWB_XP]
MLSLEIPEYLKKNKKLVVSEIIEECDQCDYSYIISESLNLTKKKIKKGIKKMINEIILMGNITHELKREYY